MQVCIGFCDEIAPVHKDHSFEQCLVSLMAGSLCLSVLCMSIFAKTSGLVHNFEI